MAFLRRMIWLYFFLLIAEGALRKWALPSLGAPLLVIRDPARSPYLCTSCAVPSISRQWSHGGLFSARDSVSFFWLFSNHCRHRRRSDGGGLWSANKFSALAADFCNPASFLLSGRGQARPMGAHAVRADDRFDDLAIHVSARQLDQCRNQCGGNGQQITSALGRIRPAGTFSFATGAAHFYVLATVFLIFGLARAASRLFTLVAGGGPAQCDIVVQPVSGSRNLVLGCALTLVAAVIFAVLAMGASLQRILVSGGSDLCRHRRLILTSFL